MEISIIIRAYNEEKYLGKALVSIINQESPYAYEIILVDSGSTDNTIHIASEFNCKIIQIPSVKFSFGYSLNKGIEAAQGKYCVIISAHCFPKNKLWLENLIKPFEDETIALVYGKQRGAPTSIYSEQQIFEKWYPEESEIKQSTYFCNNANAAIKKSIWQECRYDESLTGLEDIDWAKKILAKGYHISYISDAEVIHIHSESCSQIYKRYEREAIAFKKINPHDKFSFYDFIKLFFSNIFSDYINAFHDRVFFKNIFSIPMFRFLQFWGTYKGYNYRKMLSTELKQRFYYPKGSKKNLKSEIEKGKRQEENYIYDISMPLNETTIVWPSNEKFKLTSIKNLDNDGVNETRVSFNSHLGTHIDAPYHFFNSGKKIRDIPLNRLIGKTYVMEFYGKDSIKPASLEKIKFPKDCNKILFKTLNSLDYINKKEFRDDFIALDPTGANWLVEKKFQLVGIDYLSIQKNNEEDNLTHKILLGNNIIILEGLILSNIKEGIYNLIALPINITEAESAPVRAILTKEKFL